METSICSTSKQSGVLSTKNTIKLSVTMLTIGKISEENHNCLTIMPMNFVKIGKLALLSVSMKKAVYCKHHAYNVMVGKNRNIIHLTTKQSSVKKRIVQPIWNVHFIIPMWTGGFSYKT